MNKDAKEQIDRWEKFYKDLSKKIGLKNSEHKVEILDLISEYETALLRNDKVMNDVSMYNDLSYLKQDVIDYLEYNDDEKDTFHGYSLKEWENCDIYENEDMKEVLIELADYRDNARMESVGISEIVSDFQNDYEEDNALDIKSIKKSVNESANKDINKQMNDIKKKVLSSQRRNNK